MDIKKYTERLATMLTKYREKNSQQLHKIEQQDINQINARIDNLIALTIREVVKIKGDSSASEEQNLKQKIKALNSMDGAIGHIVNPYNRARNAALDLSNEREQTAKAHLYEQFRIVLFRMLSGIGIAVIVLCASWVAHELEIPLPFRLGV